MSLGECTFAFLLDRYLGVKLLILKVCKCSVLTDITKELSEVLMPIVFPPAKDESSSCSISRWIWLAAGW